MTAAQIIDQIKSLPPEEQAGVVRFVYELEAERKLSGNELSVLAGRFVNASDPAEASRVREEIVRGFYGGKSNILNSTARADRLGVRSFDRRL